MMVADQHYPNPNANARLLTNGETLSCISGCEKLHQLDNDNSALNSELHDLRNQLSSANAAKEQAERRAGELREFAIWVTEKHAQQGKQWGGCHVHNCRVCRMDALLASQPTAQADVICPNCHKPAPGGLYETCDMEDANGNEMLKVVHCGCYHEAKHGEADHTAEHDLQIGIHPVDYPNLNDAQAEADGSE
jgi:hypothetical protein